MNSRVKKVFSSRYFISACAAALILAGAIIAYRAFKKPGEEAAFRSVPVSDFPVFTDLPPKAGLISSAEKSIAYFASLSSTKKFYQVGDRKVTPALLADSLREFIRILKGTENERDLNRKIREKFDLFQSVGQDGNGKVVFSSYYEPVLEASRVRTKEFRFPLYRKPADLVEVDLELFDEFKWRGERIFGRVEKDKVVPYFTREQIDYKKVLAGKGLELVWLKDRIDVMDLHIEGSARLAFRDGSEARVHYAGTNGLTFKGWVTLLVNSGVIGKDEVTHERAKKYIEEHPEIEPWVLSSNKRYTFFELQNLKNSAEGPRGTMGAPLTGGRSVAIDQKLVPLGALIYMSVSMPRVKKDGTVLGIFPDSRFALCQDTGGAILGPGRVDFFSGTGPAAKAIATSMWEPGTFYLLLLKVPVET